ncbi:hypothetical protein PGT21_003482 [Puccinia graminis f. sp. tritici]|uniref:Uncharacterized protein n=1 Tax=Puccinia graminis f. sp. tritici TaxID=56615 RepID=A0A5B0MV47_PUCGR|nr:hypothetical protein PGT21_003482 [Puccinia graminis f. sp. tritici]KAA1079984.1 hypothetical protein PGTUg99_017936 [Puccinia graminis f. sp. tritici]
MVFWQVWQSRRLVAGLFGLMWRIDETCLKPVGGWGCLMMRFKAIGDIQGLRPDKPCRVQSLSDWQQPTLNT